MRHEEDGFSAGSVLLSFLLGGMVGAGVALLMAPQSGADTRRKIREMADEAKEKATDYVSHAKEMVSSTVEKGKGIYEERKSAITAAIEAGKDAYEKEVHK
ncbi:MAG: YtxH domain-containing protein [Nitrospirae bacterium]|nr:YtxH domain-containing protein [Nitrospirota bacterium]